MMLIRCFVMGYFLANTDLMATLAHSKFSSPMTFITFICQTDTLIKKLRRSVFTEIFWLYDLDNVARYKSPWLSLDILKTDETANSCFLLCMQMMNYRWEIGKRRFYSFAGLKQTGLVSEQQYPWTIYCDIAQKNSNPKAFKSLGTLLAFCRNY